MTLKITVSNQKGGVGKTDLCVNLSTCLASAGKRVLLIDMDPQANSTDYLTKLNPEISIWNLLMENEIKLEDATMDTEIENLSLIPSSIRLSTAQVQMANEVNMQFKLKTKAIVN